MPELPEVETVARGLALTMEGRVLTRVEQRRPDLRRPFPPDFAARLTGRRVLSLGRRAKYMLVRLDGGLVLLVHLGMSGRMVVSRADQEGRLPAPGRHDHVVMRLDDGAIVTFNDPRRFGLMDLMAETGVATHPLLADLGPEPLGNDFSAPVLRAALAARSGPIKTVLLDQTVVAGLGNIYVAEALFRAGIDPGRPASSLSHTAVDRLAAAIVAVLTEAIAAGGSSLRDFVHANGELGYFQHRFAVYGRAGEACPGCDCDITRTGGIQRLVQAGRSTFHCPQRQR